MNRREFLSTSMSAFVLAKAEAMAAATPRQDKPKKSIMPGMIKAGSTLEEKFSIAKKAGFDGIEVPPTFDQVDAYRAASEKAGIPIHSVIYGGWKPTLSDPDPKMREAAVELLKKGIQFAKAVGADNLLLVPAVVNEKTRYAEAYERSQDGIRKALPTAEENKVVLAVEEVWNNFLLSPLEFNRYVDEFQSPWVKAYFDIGNIMKNGWPEDWIRTLGKRIHRVHLKDFSKKKLQFVRLTEGDVNWKEVRKAFAEVGFTNYMTVEFNGDDYLEPDELVRRIDKIFSGD